MWGWVEASEIKSGDITGIPSIKYNNLYARYYFGYDNIRNKNIVRAPSRNLGRFFGYFLGDGSTCLYKKYGGRVKLEFNKNDVELLQKYSDVLKSLNFNYKIINRESEGLMTLLFESVHVARNLHDNFYINKEKVLPIEINRIPNQMAVGILEGLIDSDGNTTSKDGYNISNTSKNIIMTAHLLLARFGIKHSILKRNPREGGFNSRNRKIVGKKDEYIICINQLNSKLLDVLFNYEEHEMILNLPDYLEYSIEKVEEVEYNNDVYDLQVSSNTHSFAGFGMVVHNSGDWIDIEVAKRFGYDPDHPGRDSRETPTTVCRKKEKMDLSKDPDNKLEQAIKLMYEILVENVVGQIVKGFNENRDKYRFDSPIPIINAGGTCMPSGFIELISKKINDVSKDLCVPIGEIRKAHEPLFAVSRGCLLAAELHKDA